jgi:hypothetical chaperone protein
MYIGLDFGTTNSGAAVFDGHRVHVFALDPASHNADVIRSALYVTRDHQVSIGQEAIDTYYRHNTERSSHMVRQYVGEIEMTFAEIGTFMKDVYVLVDELTPGRLLYSLKSELSGGYEGTTIFGRYYALEELIATYLGQIRQRVEAESGRSVDGVVLGRPVNFVGSGAGEADNMRAEARLRRAAEMAGFRDVAFELEPVAAALHYELTLDAPQNIVVFDFGGGTLDITVMRVGEGNEGQRQVFATGGVGIAGDVFDQRIIEGVVLDHFGRGSTWGHDSAPFPRQYTDALVNWQTIPEINNPETLQFLRWAQITGSDPSRVRALESLLLNNRAAHLIDTVERAKVALSTLRFSLIQLTGQDIDVWQPLTRSQFEALIADAARHIEACLLETLGRSGLKPDNIDRIVRTGGSAQIPYFIGMMGRIFGPDKVVLSDVFSGVTAGLAIRAHMHAQA